MIWIGHKTHQFAYEMVYFIALEMRWIEVEQAVLLKGHIGRISIRERWGSGRRSRRIRKRITSRRRRRRSDEEEKESQAGAVGEDVGEVKKWDKTIYEMTILLLLEVSNSSGLIQMPHSKLNRNKADSLNCAYRLLLYSIQTKITFSMHYWDLPVSLTSRRRNHATISISFD